MGDFSNSIIPFVGLPTVELNGPSCLYIHLWSVWNYYFIQRITNDYHSHSLFRFSWTW